MSPTTERKLARNARARAPAAQPRHARPAQQPAGAQCRAGGLRREPFAGPAGGRAARGRDLPRVGPGWCGGGEPAVPH